MVIHLIDGLYCLDRTPPGLALKHTSADQDPAVRCQVAKRVFTRLAGDGSLHGRSVERWQATLGLGQGHHPKQPQRYEIFQGNAVQSDDWVALTVDRRFQTAAL